MSADRDYFDWTSPAHAEGCRRTGWDIRARGDEHITGRRDITVQAVCPLPGGCGVVHDWSTHLTPDSDPERDVRSDHTFRSLSVAQIGYGTAPIKVGGRWLHAGAPLLYCIDPTPDYYLVTDSPASPTRWQDVLGTVGAVHRNGRLLKGRWWASAGYRPDRFGRATASVGVDNRPSRGAAVAWVGANHDVAAVEQPVGGEA